jgi:hypothetical protein
MPAPELVVTVDCKNPTALRAVRLLVDRGAQITTGFPDLRRRPAGRSSP